MAASHSIRLETWTIHVGKDRAFAGSACAAASTCDEACWGGVIFTRGKTRASPVGATGSESLVGWHQELAYKKVARPSNSRASGMWGGGGGGGRLDRIWCSTARIITFSLTMGEAAAMANADAQTLLVSTLSWSAGCKTARKDESGAGEH